MNKNIIKKNKELLSILDNLTAISLDLIEITKNSDNEVDRINDSSTTNVTVQRRDNCKNQKSSKKSIPSALN